MVFAARLRDRRKTLGMTIAECATRLGKTQPAWTLYETGKRFPKLDEFLEICTLLDTTPNELLGVGSRSDRALVNAGDGSAVAIGGNASVTTVVPSTPTGNHPFQNCSKCPYKAAVTKLRKAGLEIPGVE